VLALIAALTMSVGNLVALRQHRMVRLLAWSSVAQAGYLLSPLGILAVAPGRTDEAVRVAVTAVLAYTVFYISVELGAFGAVVALRGANDGGDMADYAGAARRHPGATAAFALAIAGLAGLPPGFAGLFAKVAVVKALLGGGVIWLAVLLAVNAVVGLAYYVRAVAALFVPAGVPGRAVSGEQTVDLTAAAPPPRRAVAWPVAVGLAVITLVALVIGLAPQLVLDAI
jgi:NADH-quinone oxidoreductase subunit N